ncbi:glycoside hydrolase family 92 protein [Pedobacter sp. BS3]|uniref:GH92 family glycosyl hydrolase n=1 Tax=Pedobacter sp. BS3 TaxID=2567937 RepID=UPI0011EC1BBF|nr:GH92 family glycosyl hydrolase [Pedobacter sp. BS3]TZF82258.1 glycoside hydrolase family 92 protein [Pedobacter sp. BS3]
MFHIKSFFQSKRTGLLATVLMYITGSQLLIAQTLPIDDVNPFIGTANQKSAKPNWKNGETFPGAMVPWGMVSVSPHTAPDSKSGYRYGEPYLYGFGHVQLSGVGCGDLGNIVLMPTSGSVAATPEGWRSAYHDEKASPGYYKTVLQSGIIAEMTATTRTGISKYTFPADTGNILIDVSATQNKRMMPAPGYVKIVSGTEVEGWTESGHFCGAPNQVQKVYFVARFSQTAVSSGTWTATGIAAAAEQSGRGVGAFLRFNTSRNKVVEVKVGISYVSIANARLNLAAEQTGFSFDAIHHKARELWNTTLSRIEVEGGTQAQKTIFYTGLYHILLHPSVFNDVNGDYQKMGHTGIAKARGYTRYNVFSLWDTYRNLHVFLTLFYPERQHDMVKTLLEMYKESGWLPKWELAGNDALVMVGDPAPVVLAGTYFNGLRDFDIKLAYQAMKHNATDTANNPIRKDLKIYLEHRYVPVTTRGSVSETLEYGISDYAIAQMAKVAGNEKDYRQFMERSQYYKNLYDPQTGFLRPKKADGSWVEPFNPDEFKGNGFIEGSAWNYLFCVPYDIPGLSQVMGGDSVYIKRLQQTFDERKFVLYNEPDIAYPYFFTHFKNEAWRTQKAVREGMKMNYNTTPGGLPGNDDCGALSAWYVFSAMGFYPANPVSGEFRLGSPVFSKVTIHLNQNYYKGRTFVINAARTSEQNKYITSQKLNGRLYEKPYITYRDIENGGVMELNMSDTRRPATVSKKLLPR